VIIELAGLPGSGKTSITRELMNADRTIDRKVMSSDFGRALRHPVALVATLARYGAYHGRATRRWLKIVMRHHHQRHMPGTGARMLILEEGVTHHLWRTLFLFPELRSAHWASLLDVPQPLVVFDAPPDVRRERIKAKTVASGQINDELASTDPSEEPWTRGAEIFDRMIDAAARARHVVRVSTDGALADAVIRTRSAISSLG
jgi:predicted kinase